MRPVPRNIDRPNRNAERAFAFLISWYGTMFLTESSLIAFCVTVLVQYAVYKLTLNKPEGAAFRLYYRFGNIGKFFPNPKTAKKFEI